MKDRADEVSRYLETPIFIFIFIFVSYFLKFILFLSALGLCCCARAFSSCGERGLLFVAVCRLLIAVASLVGSTGSRRAGSVVVAHGL